MLSPNLPPPSKSLEPAKLLIIDDDPSTRRLLAGALGRLGFAVEAAATASEGFEKLSSTPDLVVLDFELPEMDGLEVCARIRQHAEAKVAEVPIVLLTAHSGEEEEVRSLKAGANDFVTKPVSLAVLEARINTQLRLQAMRRELKEQNNELERWHRAREMDLEAAQATQRAIIPGRPPRIDGYEVASYYQPLIQVGGDAYGWEPLGKSHWLFWIADATGHGASAALLTALSRMLFQHAGSTSKSPAEILRKVNQDFFAVFNGRSFMTGACAVLNPAKGTVVFAGAGHPPLLIVRKDGRADQLPALGTLLGLKEQLDVTEESTTLEPGDLAFLYTDGFFSLTRQDGERMNHTDLCDQVRSSESATQFINEVLQAMAATADEPVLSDDTAGIVVRRAG